MGKMRHKLKHMDDEVQIEIVKRSYPTISTRKLTKKATLLDITPTALSRKDFYFLFRQNYVV